MRILTWRQKINHPASQVVIHPSIGVVSIFLELLIPQLDLFFIVFYFMEHLSNRHDFFRFRRDLGRGRISREAAPHHCHREQEYDSIRHDAEFEFPVSTPQKGKRSFFGRNISLEPLFITKTGIFSSRDLTNLHLQK